MGFSFFVSIVYGHSPPLSGSHVPVDQLLWGILVTFSLFVTLVCRGLPGWIRSLAVWIFFRCGCGPPPPFLRYGAVRRCPALPLRCVQPDFSNSLLFSVWFVSPGDFGFSFFPTFSTGNRFSFRCTESVFSRSESHLFAFVSLRALKADAFQRPPPSWSVSPFTDFYSILKGRFFSISFLLSAFLFFPPAIFYPIEPELDSVVFVPLLLPTSFF